VIQNSIDLPRIELAAQQSNQIALPQRARAMRILLAANYVREKGLHTAICAIEKLVRMGCDPVLYLAGGVPFGAARSYVDELKLLCSKVGVCDRVEWLGVRSDIPALIRASTVVVLPTHTEGMPRILLEAMALGVPVVSTPVGGVLDLVQPSITGELVEIEDPEGLASAIRALHLDEKLRDRVVRNARVFVTEQLNVERHTMVLQSLVGRLSRREREQTSDAS
jgi:glycosyltransferase involved in cell wall biosynthesis